MSDSIGHIWPTQAYPYDIIIFYIVANGRRWVIVGRSDIYIKLAIYYVIPAAAKRRAGIQQKHRYYWIPAFAGMTGR